VKFDEHFLEEVRTATDIVELISPYVKLKKKGKNWFGLCPFHNEKTPSFSVNRERGMYYCFGCGAGGNAITFLTEREGMSFPQAVEELARRAGIPMPRRSAEPGTDRTDRLRGVLEESADWFAANLKAPQGRPAVDYLKERGITGVTARTFRIGFAPPGWDGLHSHLNAKGVPDTLMAEAGLVKRREGGGYYDTFRNRIVFPFMDRRGRVIGFGGRLLGEEEDGPKYLNSPETPLYSKGKVLYGLPQAVKALLKEERALLVEGYFDVMSLHQAGIEAVIAASGTAFTHDQALILKRLVKKVLLLFDADPAGIKAALGSYTSLVHEGLEVAFLGMPSGDDPDTLIRSEGAEAFRSRLRHAETIVPFYLAQLSPTLEERDVGGRAQAARGLLELLRYDSDELRRALSLQQLSVRIGLDENTLKRELETIAARESAWEQRPDETGTERAAPAPGRLETELIRLLITRADLRPELMDGLEENDFHDQRTRALFTLIASEPGAAGIDHLIEQAPARARNLLASILADDAGEREDRDVELAAEIKAGLESRRLKSKRKRLRTAIEQAKRAGDEDTLARLLKEYQELR